MRLIDADYLKEILEDCNGYLHRDEIYEYMDGLPELDLPRTIQDAENEAVNKVIESYEEKILELVDKIESLENSLQEQKMINKHRKLTGSWIVKINQHDEITGFFCSRCGTQRGQVSLKFCANCGADLRTGSSFLREWEE